MGEGDTSMGEQTAATIGRREIRREIYRMGEQTAATIDRGEIYLIGEQTAATIGRGEIYLIGEQVAATMSERIYPIGEQGNYRLPL